MQADEVFSARVEGIAVGGTGFARIAGKSMFIEGVAEGETVRCRVTKDHRNWAQAELLEVIDASPERVQPACAFYGICGGCNLQHLSYQAQLAAKTAILCDTFRRIGRIVPPQPRVFASQPWEYRNRMQFHAGTDSWGLKSRGGSDIIAVNDCPVADPGIRRLLRAEGGQRQPPGCVLPERGRFNVYARSGLLLSEWGTRQGRTKVLDRELCVDAALFFQSNGTMLESLVAGLRELVTGCVSGIPGADCGRPMADIYCGVGTFAAFLGDYVPHIDLVEENKSALSLARENLGTRAAGKTAELYAMSAEDWVNNAVGGSPGRDYGFVVVDPPRQGLSPGVTRWLAAAGPPLIAYVSCDPATLARDSRSLFDGSYELAELRLYDFYPQTAHIESLSVFRR